MPSLVLFERRTFIGGDDLQPTCAIAILYRVMQMLFLLLPVLIHLLYEAQTYGFLFYFTHLTYDDVNDDENGDNDDNPIDSCDRRHSELTTFSQLLLSYTLLTLVYCIVTIYMEVKLWNMSNIGTPTRSHARRDSIVPMLEFKLLYISLIHVGIFVLGISTISYSLHYTFQGENEDFFDSCDQDDTSLYFQHSNLLPFENGFWSNFWRICLLLMLLSQLLELVLSILSWIHIYHLPKEADVLHHSMEYRNSWGTHHPSYYYNANQNDVLWENRCRFWCKVFSFTSCYLFGGHEVDSGDFSDIARALTDYVEHGGTLDIVPSDIVAGLILLQKKQYIKNIHLRQQIMLEQHEQMVRANSTSRSNYVMDSTSNNITSDKKDEKEEDELMKIRQSYSNLEHQPQQPNQNGFNIHNASFPFSTPPNSNKNIHPLSNGSILSPDQQSDVDIIAEGARFSRHALAIYTWILYVYMKPCGGMCELTIFRSFSWLSEQIKQKCCGGRVARGGSSEHHHRRRDFPSRFSQSTNHNSSHLFEQEQKQHIQGDNYFQLHKSALLTLAGLNNSELIYGQFESGLRTTPYCIVLDHKWKSVVLSIRGTLSLEDCVVDVLVDAESLQDVGRQYGFDGEGEYCHAGMLDCAKWIMEDLKNHGILEHLLRVQYPNYTLRIVGHSLGAGCAVLLAYMLRQNHPTLRCLAYSPPGGFCTHRTATSCKDFVTTFVLNNDLVSRLSVENMERLRDEILTIIGEINIPKISVLRSIFATENDEDNENIERLLNDMILREQNSSIPKSSYYAHQLAQFQQIQKQRKEEREQVNVSLFPPGKIVHLVKTAEPNASCTDALSSTYSDYTPIWAENHEFSEIVVSPTMGLDHFPNTVCLELEGVARSFGIDSSLGSPLECIDGSDWDQVV